MGLQCILFYIPKFIWQTFCFSQSGTNLDTIVKQSVSISEKPMCERSVEYENIAKIIENMLVLHRDFRNNKSASIRRKLFSKCSLLINSKRLGTMLVSRYFVVKLLYLVNAVGQLFLIQAFLGFNNHFPYFGTNFFRYIIFGTEFDSKNYFPKVVFCHVRGILHAGTTNNYIAQCVLPVNMLNEKIYTFLWFWILIIAVVTLVSIPLWIFRLFGKNGRARYIRKFLKMVGSYEEHKRSLVHRFINDFLGYDGMFLVRMIAHNAGDIMASHLISNLWSIYLKKYQNRNLRKDFYPMVDCLSINLTPGTINGPLKFTNDPIKTLSQLHYL